MPLSFRQFALGCAAFACAAMPISPTLAAQQSMPSGPPKVLVINREYLKPGKGGNLHEKSESAFVRAMQAAKYPTTYFALDSLSGPSRSLFLVSYDSFADWEKDNMAMRKNKTLSAAIDKAVLADGELLSEYDTSALALREDLSLPMKNNGLLNIRYFEMSLYFVKAGHEKEWEDLVKLYIDGYKKGAPDAHWDVFQLMYGTPVGGPPSGSVFLVVTLLKSLAETDRGILDDKKFAEAVGPGVMKKAGELEAASVVSWTTNLFEINPRMSYPPQAWIDAEPSFWKPAPPPAVMKKAAKPATP